MDWFTNVLDHLCKAIKVDTFVTQSHASEWEKSPQKYIFSFIFSEEKETLDFPKVLSKRPFRRVEFCCGKDFSHLQRAKSTGGFFYRGVTGGVPSI